MHFKFLNIPVYIHPSFWIFLIFISGFASRPPIESMIIAFVVFISLMVHEYGHALTARLFGKNPTVTLEAFGGNAKYDNGGISPTQDFIITLNGPLLESLLIAIAYYLLKTNLFENSYMLFFLHVTMRLNIIWCLFNLIPITPLDGGHIATYFFVKRFGEKGYMVSTILGIICAVVIAPYLYWIGYEFFCFFLVICGLQNFMKLKEFSMIKDNYSPISYYTQGMEAYKKNDLKKAKTILKSLLKSSHPYIQKSATESLAKVYCKKNETRKAYQLLLNSDYNSLREGQILLCKLAYEAQNYKLVADLSRKIYEIEPTYEIAFLISKAFAKLNNAHLAGGWLNTALLFNPTNLQKVEDLLLNEVFDLVRDHKDFKKHIANILSSINIELKH